ncbi:hypothetical protein ASPVEDRAFT_44373 [Aspergillus versicolor CBS 583.65]|uniref:ferric-chelate reductase (NADPH) n=1 Tax=Aspergillus versicolor CBS 583.65 TaxID=1036611 RepID=A0A1L9PTS0_ASPVE|nr:uncharacterized protein ASPVEDRAFT_44373 [Aspergillus versicolor CBS 583.65]OJJ04836.1 hypothetical protein ASPVEDRAFT_44373 [Aspergillus versicolor CBS 583.65]
MDMSKSLEIAKDRINPFFIQKIYWSWMSCLIGVEALANLINRFLEFQRLRDQSPTPSKPKSVFFRVYAALTVLARLVGSAALRPVLLFGRRVYTGPVMPWLFITAHFATTAVMCFYDLDTYNQWEWEEVGYRTGFTTIAQMPLVFILAGRQNIIGCLAGMGYQSLNWFHRWLARTLWLCATIHMGFWFRSWGRYSYITHQLRNEYYSQCGFAAWCVLTFIVISSAWPIRRLGYEFFVIQHLVMFIGFTVAVWLHVDEAVRAPVWASIGFLIFDRLVRYVWAAFINLSVFHKTAGTWRGLWTHHASFTPLSGNVARVTIQNPGARWKPGQHMFLTCHSIAPLQSHPFTIASIPEDGKIEFLIRAEKGATKRFWEHAVQNNVLEAADTAGSSENNRVVFLEGPYGKHRSLRQFDSLMLFAGGMGVTFTMPLLRDIVGRWKKASSQGDKPRLDVTRHIHFVWIIRSPEFYSWFGTELESVARDIDTCRRDAPDVIRDLKLSIYITEPGWMNLEDVLANQNQLGPAQTPAKTNLASNGGERRETADEHVPSPHSASRTNEGLATTKEEERSFTPQKMTLGGGRPSVDTIIRTTLQQNEGESAVVVCGPPALSDDVRRSVVCLTEERVADTGIGAQGIYLHVETFGW